MLFWGFLGGFGVFVLNLKKKFGGMGGLVGGKQSHNLSNINLTTDKYALDVL